MNTLVFVLLLSTIVGSHYFWSVGCVGEVDKTKEHVVKELRPINGSSNYRVRIKSKHQDKPWLEKEWEHEKHSQCVRRGVCESMENQTCLGAKLNYKSTSIHLTDYESQAKLLDNLSMYKALKHVPACWQILQPFLCAVFRPKCETIDGEDYVHLPSLEMCNNCVEECEIVYNTTFFTEFMKCNETLFPKSCKNDIKEIRFLDKKECLDPMVLADTPAALFPDIKNCGLRCKDPLYTDGEHLQINSLNKWGASLCLLCHLFFIATFWIDWKNANKYPAVIAFYINLCYVFICLGFLAQFVGREDIVCRKDGTLRHSEPTAGQNLSCIFIFFLIYYFTIAAMVWFVILTYAWHLKAGGKVQDKIEKKGSYFHLFAWSAPFVLTIITMAFSEIDANSIVGICFVGYINHQFRIYLLLLPLVCVIVGGGAFIIIGTNQLLKLKSYANDEKSTKVMSNIIVRMGLRSLFILGLITVAILCQLNNFKHKESWEKSLREYVICRIAMPPNSDLSSCRQSSRPSVAILQLELLCFYLSGVVMFSWCWTSSSLEAWKRFIRRKFGREPTDDVKMPKHKVIAQTWAKRKELEEEGRLSIMLHNTHTDPVGLNFDINNLNSAATNEISSTWVNNLTKFVKRRGAVDLTKRANTNSSSCPPPKNSESEIISIRHVSYEARSRRNSADSQVSVKMTRMKTNITKGRNKGTKTRGSRRRDIFEAFGRKVRRASSTSVESQIKYIQSRGIKRRSGNVGLDPMDINKFMENNTSLIMPFLKNQGMSTSEDTSMTSVKIQDSRLNIIFKNDEDDEEMEDDDDYHFNHSDDGPHIEEIHSADEIENLRQNDGRHRKNSLQLDKESLSSFSSISDFDLPGHDSISLTNRNSKNSCDVAIQANAVDIQYSFEKDDMKNALKAFNRNGRNHLYQEDGGDTTEMLQLLPPKSNVVISQMSEDEKLRRLLFPLNK